MKLTTLSGKPADFSLPLTVRELDGSEVEIQFIGIGRTTLDWQPIALARIENDANALIEQEEKLDTEKVKAVKEAKAAEAEQGAEGEKPVKRKRLKIPHAEIAKNTEQSIKSVVAMVREVASGWALEDEFSDENIKLMVTRYPGTHTKLWENYDARVKGNRLGNSVR